MQTILNNKKSELPYGPVIIAIAKRMNAFFDAYTAAPPYVQGMNGGCLL